MKQYGAFYFSAREKQNKLSKCGSISGTGEFAIWGYLKIGRQHISWGNLKRCTVVVTFTAFRDCKRTATFTVLEQFKFFGLLWNFQYCYWISSMLTSHGRVLKISFYCKGCGYSTIYLHYRITMVQPMLQNKPQPQPPLLHQPQLQLCKYAALSVHYTQDGSDNTCTL